MMFFENDASDLQRAMNQVALSSEEHFGPVNKKRLVMLLPATLNLWRWWM